MLEVLDPAQNHTFRDHYLEVDLDLSRVMFIATANVVDTIPGPLLDRMEVIRLDGYTESEKVSIARHHLVGRQLGRAALREDEVQISDDALRSIVADYTREAGVRSLERELGRLLRKVATKLAAGEREAPVVVDAPDVRGWLGRPHFYFEAAERTSVPGVVTGLAVTGAGGCRYNAPDGAREASLAEHGAHFLLRSLRVAQPGGMENVKIDDDVVVCRDFRDHWKQRPRRLREPGVLGVRGEEMDTLSLMIVLRRCAALSVHSHGAKVRELSNPVIPPGQRLQHQFAHGFVSGCEPAGD